MLERSLRNSFVNAQTFISERFCERFEREIAERSCELFTYAHLHFSRRARPHPISVVYIVGVVLMSHDFMFIACCMHALHTGARADSARVIVYKGRSHSDSVGLL